MSRRMNSDTLDCALERIRRGSIFWSARAEHKTGFTGTWRTFGCWLTWQIFDCAARDYWSGERKLTAEQYASAKRTALTGWITTPAGRERNILEALNIDPAWAARQWATAEEYREAA